MGCMAVESVKSCSSFLPSCVPATFMDGCVVQNDFHIVRQSVQKAAECIRFNRARDDFVAYDTSRTMYCQQQRHSISFRWSLCMYPFTFHSPTVSNTVSRVKMRLVYRNRVFSIQSIHRVVERMLDIEIGSNFCTLRLLECESIGSQSTVNR